ncbi:MAG TPA: nuclear transport factor 2 family protein [Tepidisphaeraceae bacterium]|jgi:ketosteroid isomerase-like protein
MKTVFVLSLLVATTAFAQSSADVPTTITQLEHRWAEAQAAGKPDIVASMLADDFISVGTDGKLTSKSELLAHLKPGHWERNEISDVKVVVHDNVAVATGLWTGKGQMGDRHIDLTERWTDTWIRTGSGQWQCLASQQTEIRN